MNEQRTLVKETDNYKLYIRSFNNDEGHFFKIKQWMPKIPAGHESYEFIKALWLNEARQLRKIKTANNASKYIETLQKYYIENGCFYLIYQSGPNHKSLQEVIQKQESLFSFSGYSNHWLYKDNLTKPHHRLTLWKNILRLVNGLEILHSRGIIHRNIGLHSIISKDDPNYPKDEQFILAGFEKSLDYNKPKLVAINESKRLVYTTHQDWQDLAALILDILSIKHADWSTNSYLNKNEKNVIKELYKGISSKKVQQGVTSINTLRSLIGRCIQDYSLIADKIDSQIHVSIIKEDREKLIEQIRSIKNNPRLGYDEIAEILQHDLDKFPALVVGKSNRRNDNRQEESGRAACYLAGREFIYRLQEFKHKEYTYNSVMLIRELIVPDEKSKRLNYIKSRGESVKVHRSVKFIKDPFLLERKFKKIAHSWNGIFDELNKQITYEPFELECLQGLLMSIAVGQSLLEIQRFNVSFEEVGQKDINEHPDVFIDDDKTYYYAKMDVSKNIANTRLAKAIGKTEADKRFNDALKEDNAGDVWVAERKVNNGRIENNELINLQFLKRMEKENIFLVSDEVHNSPSIMHDQQYIFYPSEVTGTEFQINRQVQIFKHLLQNMPLAKSLSRPMDVVNIQKQESSIEHILSSFDDSKRHIFSHLIQTYPSYYIEGPPGVGKTFLVSNYVKYLFSQEDNAKLLLTAQAHATVNLLHKSTKDALGDAIVGKLLIISDFRDGLEAYRPDDESVSKRYEIVRPYLKKLEDSPLYRKYVTKQFAGGEVRDKLDKFTKDYEHGFYRATIKAADLVFTTSNSGLMASLVDNDVVFDVSIMEESAKASGMEMVGAMLVANKRVMIGDAKQLPAFSEGVVEKIVSNATCEDVTEIINQLKAVQLKTDELTSLKMSLNNDKDLEQEEADEFLEYLQRYFPLFKSLSEDARVSKDTHNFGGMLSIQHRMHPEICDIISQTVYNNELVTDEARAARVKSINFYFDENNAQLSGLNRNNAVIWVDIPDIKEHSTIIPLECNNTNDTEVKIIDRLRQSISRDDASEYSLKVLSPYLGQVRKLNRELSENIAHTVDSFQGNEADVIIVSMVRHNHKPNIRQALGFLVDMRRMNVLLSRAKHKLIIVGCFGLFKVHLEREKRSRENFSGVLSDDNFGFLNRFVSLLESDYQTMLDDSIEESDKQFEVVNFVSAKNYCGL